MNPCKLHRKSLVVIVTVVLACGFVQSRDWARAADTTRYVFNDLGMLPGHNAAIPTAINKSGVVVGYCYDAALGVALPLRSQAFIWDKGEMRALAASSGSWAEARDINDAGVVVGNMTKGAVTLPVQWVALKPTLLSDHPGTAETVNNQGDIAGVQKGLVIWGKVAYPEWTLPVGMTLHVTASNAHGDVCGYTEKEQVNSNSDQRAFVWSRGKAVHLPMPDGGTSIARSMDDAGGVVGWVSVDPGMHRAVVWEKGTLSYLDAPKGWRSEATAVSPRGLIAGWVQKPGEPSRMCIWRRGLLTDLSEASALPKGWSLTLLTGVNDQGWIIGRGYQANKERAFLLKPHTS
jgi:uncharacterized membrane protein